MIPAIRRPLAIAALALLATPGIAAAATADALLPRNLSPWGMFMQADFIVKAVMIGLAFASLVTWTIWLARGGWIWRLRGGGHRVLCASWRAPTVSRRRAPRFLRGGPARVPWLI